MSVNQLHLQRHFIIKYEVMEITMKGRRKERLDS